MKKLKNKTISNHELAKISAKAKAKGEVIIKHRGCGYCDNYCRIGNAIFRRVSEFNWQEVGQMQQVGGKYEIKYY